MKVFFGRFYGVIKERIGDIPSTENPQGKKEGI
jgi:hypothetical protein